MYSSCYDYEIQQFFIYYKHELVAYFDPTQPSCIDFANTELKLTKADLKQLNEILELKAPTE